MPPIAWVSGITGRLGNLVVGCWKGSMQTPEEGRTTGMPLRLGESGLLQDVLQRSHDILRGKMVK